LFSNHTSTRKMQHNIFAINYAVKYKMCVTVKLMLNNSTGGLEDLSGVL